MRIAAFALPLALVAGLAGCAPSGAPDRTAAPAAAAADTVLVPVTSAELRALAARPGARATLLNVWATWCGPCREEFPALLAAARRHPELRLVLVSADFDDQLHEVRAFLGAHGVTDTTYLKAEADQEFIDGLEPAWSGALPATIAYDANGRAVEFWEGGADSARFEQAITKALQATATAHGGTAR